MWKFIIEREIEAPDRFQSIQTYRCILVHRAIEANIRHSSSDCSVAPFIARRQ